MSACFKNDIYPFSDDLSYLFCVFFDLACACTRVCSLTQQEQALAQSQVRRSSPERGGSDTKTVDIIKMLTNAQTDYEKVRF